MSKVYELTEGDDIRTIKLTLGPADPVPTEATLIATAGADRLEFPLELDTDGKWKYRFTDADFTTLSAGGRRMREWKGKVNAVFSDGTSGTFATTYDIKIKVFKQP